MVLMPLRPSFQTPAAATIAARAVVFAICVGIAQAQAAVYSVVELGTLGGTSSIGSALNVRGEVVGQSASHPFLFGSQGMIDLGAPPGFIGIADAINDHGTVVGSFYSLIGGEQRAFMYRSGVMTELADLQLRSLIISAINTEETIVGWWIPCFPCHTRAFAWSAGKIADLDTLGGADSAAYGVNSAGQIVGAATTSGDAELHAVVWTNGVPTDLGTLGGMRAAAHGINERGQIVGDSFLPGDNVIHAFLYENGVMRDLDPDPTHRSTLWSINALGDAVGGADTGSVYMHGRLVPLSSLLDPYTDWRINPVDINDQGLILGNGCRGADICRAFVAVLLTPLKPPEPPPPGQVNVIEFYHAGMDHFFISSLAAEIDALDSGRYPGWERTGEYFHAFPQQVPLGTSPVCRFYIPPAYGDSHFFSASPAECAATRAKFPQLAYETDAAFFIYSPDAQGNCPSTTVPVYRLWSHRADSNHRYTTDRGVRDTMVKAGWAAEGNGPDITIMCAPK